MEKIDISLNFHFSVMEQLCVLLEGISHIIGKLPIAPFLLIKKIQIIIEVIFYRLGDIFLKNAWLSHNIFWYIFGEYFYTSFFSAQWSSTILSIAHSIDRGLISHCALVRARPKGTKVKNYQQFNKVPKSFSIKQESFLIDQT